MESELLGPGDILLMGIFRNHSTKEVQSWLPAKWSISSVSGHNYVHSWVVSGDFPKSVCNCE